MDLPSALQTELSASTVITALTSNRIFPMFAPQSKKKPYVTYREISNIPQRAMVNDAPITMSRYQISIRSTSYSDLVSLSTAVKSTLRDKTGTLGTSNFNVQRIFFDGQFEFPEVNPETEKIIYHRAQDYIIWTTG